MLLTLVRIFFGVDMALGFFNYAVLSWLAGQRFNVIFLLISILSTHFPDVDMIPFLILRNRYRLACHWIVGHHPPLVLFFVAAVSYTAAKMWIPDRVGYTTALTTVGVLLHFSHDGTSELGFPWLSPFSLKRFRFRIGKPIIVPQAETDQWTDNWKARERSAAEEIYDRAEPIKLAHHLLWGAAMLVLVIFFIES